MCGTLTQNPHDQSWCRTVPKLENVNTTDVRAAIELGCRTMQSVFDADDDHMPFFKSRIVPHHSDEQTFLQFNVCGSESHVPGRHLNALLSAEDAAGISLDERAIDNHTRAAKLSFSGPVALPLNREIQDGKPIVFTPHNCREGMHALYALVKYRDCDWARQTAEHMIDSVFTYWSPQHGWKFDALKQQGLQPRHNHGFISGEARMIGPLVKYFRATGYDPALELAMALKEKAIAEFFLETGGFDTELFGTHTHSTTCVMSSLAQLADLTNDSTLMDRVRVFYDCGLRDIRDELGWVIEGAHPDKNPDQGECNNTGDIVEAALILGRWGWPRYFHDAERIVRGHLLPSQLRDNSFITDPPNPDNEDGKRNLADRHLGAFGFPAPYGHQPVDLKVLSFNMDVVGGVVGSLCEVLREATRLDDAGHWVNLLFDHETEAIRVQSPYTHDRLSVTIKKPAPLSVRIPPWVDRKHITVAGLEPPHRFTNQYLFIADAPVATPIKIGFDLAAQDMVLKHRTRDIRVRLRGDEVVTVDNFGADLTFFDPYD